MILSISAGPHLHASHDTRRLMLHVILSLIPCAACGIYLFGIRCALHLLITVASSVGFEYLYRRLARKTVSVGDLSAVITGMLLALSIPAGAPLWIGCLGSLFAIVIAKQLFGGLGHNFINPALFARAVLLASFPQDMTSFAFPIRTMFTGAADAVSSATVLNGSSASVLDLFLGNIAGCPGEVCKAAILIGFLVLALTGTIRWHIPVIVMGTLAGMSFLLGTDPLAACLSGSALFGAVFMATDYVTSPMLIKSQCIYAAFIGIVMALIRAFGSFPEGTTYAIMLANIITPLLDKYLKRRIYGEVKKA